MNKKTDILDAMILIEKLTEGDIDLKKVEENLPLSCNENDTIIPNMDFFLNFIEKKSEEETKKKTEKKTKKETEEKTKKETEEKSVNFGVVLYFGIFEFEKIKNLLPQKYKMQKNDEEVSKSNKYTFFLTFNKDFELDKKIFYTTSGYFKEHGKFPEDISKAQDDLFNELKKSFEDDFDGTLAKLFEKYGKGLNEFRYKFISKIDDIYTGHSPFVYELQNAKRINTKNLNQFLGENSKNRINLDGKNDSPNFNPKVLEDILQPKNYPSGRFPSNVNFAPCFMQQVAINIALEKNDENILSVNGPPGTGKTTLLKDIFAEFVVRQSYKICKENLREISKDKTIGKLPCYISDYNIVVASSNNGAVENIVNELPLTSQIDSQLINEICEADYFYDIVNNKSAKNWGMFSLAGGRNDNITILNKKLQEIVEYLNKEYKSSPNVYAEFDELYKEVEKEKNKVQKIYEKCKSLNTLKLELKTSKEKLSALDCEYAELEKQLSEFSSQLILISDSEKQAQRNYDMALVRKPAFFWLMKIIRKAKVNKYYDELKLANDQLNEIVGVRKKIETIISDIENKKGENIKIHNKLKNNIEKIPAKIKELEEIYSKHNIKPLDFSVSYEDLQKSNSWFDKDFRILQSKLFISALKVKKEFLYENRKNLKIACDIFKNTSEESYFSDAWNWINFTIPVIGTTFASFRKMFNRIKDCSIGNLFIDEAGQATPVSCIGALLRCKRIMAVGDPAQIKPVVTIESKILNYIKDIYNIDSKFISADSSIQTMFDSVGKYGYAKSEDEWIGIPLWVHRRCMHPMFDISNVLSYGGLMVQGKDSKDAQGVAQWYDCKGNAKDKYVEEQGDLLVKLIDEKLKEGKNKIKDIFVITPFKNVEIKIKEKLKVNVDIGTVHTFQGKEAKIVYLVLGADENCRFSASWAVSEPNIMNVASTRAKEEFYVIGDKKLYSSLKSQVVDNTLSVLTYYNENN